MRVFVLIKIIWLGLLLMLASCGGGGSGENSTAESSTDKASPKITILGDNPATAVQGFGFSEEGAIAFDETDGDLDVTREGQVDVNTVGTYVIKYSAIDNAGNITEADRTVHVKQVQETKNISQSVSSTLFINSSDSYRLIGITTDEPIDTGGNVNINLLDNKSGQLLFIDGKNLTYPVPVQFKVDGNSSSVQLTEKNITKGLIHLALLKEGIEKSAINSIILNATKVSEFSEINEIIKNSSGDFNKVFSNEVVYLIHKIKIKATENLFKSSKRHHFKLLRKDIGNKHYPYINDMGGNHEQFVNPTSSYYFMSVDGVREFTLWGNEGFSEKDRPQRRLNINNGYSEILFEKSHGHNLIRAGCYVIDTLTGVGCPVSSEAIANFGNYKDKSLFSSFVSVGTKAAEDYIDLKKIVALLTQKTGVNKTETLLNKLFKGVLPSLHQNKKFFQTAKKSLDGLSLWDKISNRGVNSFNGGRLLGDWILKPNSISYSINSDNGVLSEGEEILAPYGYFSINYESNLLRVGDETTFSPTIKDYKYSNNTLIYSWDFNGDKKEDKRSSDDISVKYTYQSAGTYKVSLKVTNPYGKIYNYSKEIVVSKHNPVASQAINITSLTPKLISTKKAYYKVSIAASGFDSGCDVWIKDKNGKRTLGNKTTCNPSTGEISTNIKLPQDQSGVYRIWVTDKIGEKYSNKLTIETRFNTALQSPSKPTLKSPGSPTSPGVELTETTPTLSWNVADRATSYWVAIKDVTTNTVIYKEKNIKGTSITAPILTSGHKYYWDISACNSAGCSTWSDSLHFQIKNTVVIPTLGKAEVLSPGSSTSTGIEITDKTPTMSLKKILNATHYWVKVEDVTSDSVAFEDKNVAFTSFPLLTPLTVAHNYKWRATACNTDGCGEWSDFLYFKVVDESQSLPIPSKPRNLQPGSSERDNSVNLDSKNVTLQWSSENNASKYKLSLFDYNTTRYLVENQYITGTSYDASNLVDFGHQYFWDLRACNNNNECSSKERAHFNINGQVIEPDKPTGLSPGTTSRDNPQMLSDTSPTLRWSNANNADWYKVWVIKGNLSSSGVIVSRGVRANSNSYTVDGLLEGSRYWWYVEACNNDACIDSDYYAIEIEAAQMPVPSPPVITDTYILPTGISLAWNDITGVDKYELELTDLEGSDNQNKVVTSTSGGFTNLSSDHRYKIGVRAHNSSGYGGYSYFEFKTKVAVPNAPDLIIVQTEGNNAFVAWNDITGADQYRVRLYDEDSSFSDSKYVDESPVAFLGLTPSHRYKVKIKARVNGVYSEYSDYEYFTIDNIVALCPLRHFTNNQISEYLQKGFSDLQSGVSQVAELQNFLNELGYNAGTADGIFGNGTEQAVKSYQSAKGLFADGKVGADTRDKINSTSCN